MTGEPVLTETQAGVLLRWFCEPPTAAQWFYVTRQEWNADFSQRDIFAWAYPPAPGRNKGHPVDCGDFRLQVVPSWG